MQTPQTDCQALINAILPFAEKMLVEKGEFLPYGGALQSDGKIAIIGAQDFGAGLQTSELVGLLKQALKKGAAFGQYNATALVQDAQVTAPSSGEKHDVISIACDHRNNVSINILFPYQVENGIVTIGKSITQQTRNDVFAPS